MLSRNDSGAHQKIIKRGKPKNMWRRTMDCRFQVGIVVISVVMTEIYTKYNTKPVYSDRSYKRPEDS